MCSIYQGLLMILLIDQIVIFYYNQWKMIGIEWHLFDGALILTEWAMFVSSSSGGCDSLQYLVWYALHCIYCDNLHMVFVFCSFACSSPRNAEVSYCNAYPFLCTYDMINVQLQTIPDIPVRPYIASRPNALLLIYSPALVRHWPWSLSRLKQCFCHDNSR